jgi:hypothetical protein
MRARTHIANSFNIVGLQQLAAGSNHRRLFVILVYEVLRYVTSVVDASSRATSADCG